MAKEQSKGSLTEREKEEFKKFAEAIIKIILDEGLLSESTSRKSH